MEIQTTLSELGIFAIVTQTNYKSIISIANDILARCEKIQLNLEDEREKIKNQIINQQDIDIQQLKKRISELERKIKNAFK